MDAADVVGALSPIVGGDHVLVDDDVRAGHETDWTRRFTGRSLAVVRPGTTEETAAVVRWAAANGVALVPQGGNTGLVGGSVPGTDRPSVIVSTRRLLAIGPVDPIAGQLTVGAGVTLAAVADAVDETGWDVGVDLGARDSATIGGMVATNAGGTRVVRHGMMRRNVVGVEAVLGDGSIVSRLHGLEKDNTGYDLSALLCGSEGTLGIVTAVRLRLVPALPDRWTALVACDDWADAVELARACRLGVEGIEGLEAVDASTAAVVAAALEVRQPIEAAVVVLVEWAGHGEPGPGLATAIGDRAHVVATDPSARRRLWQTRDRATEAIATTGVPHKFDVTLPLSRLARFVADVDARITDHTVHVFGHVGDGNLHVNVVGPAPDDTTVDDLVLGLVAEHDGSISAEHGIGRLKARALPLSRSETEIAAFGALKRALDPAGILNPGVLIDP